MPRTSAFSGSYQTGILYPQYGHFMRSILISLQSAKITVAQKDFFHAGYACAVGCGSAVRKSIEPLQGGDALALSGRRLAVTLCSTNPHDPPDCRVVRQRKKQIVKRPPVQPSLVQINAVGCEKRCAERRGIVLIVVQAGCSARSFPAISSGPVGAGVKTTELLDRFSGVPGNIQCRIIWSRGVQLQIRHVDPQCFERLLFRRNFRIKEHQLKAYGCTKICIQRKISSGNRDGFRKGIENRVHFFVFWRRCARFPLSCCSRWPEVCR
nr:MAG TPA: hypothetical protein [Caudoviricetes sp.]